MAGVKGRSGTNKGKDKPWQDALRLAVNRTGEDGRPRLLLIAEKCVEAALEGKMDAIKEIGDRLEGRAAQAIEHSGDMTLRHEDALEQLDSPPEGDTDEAEG